MPADLSEMLNDQLGDCTCAGLYHGRQVWSFNSNPPMDTEPDANVELVYCQACGYEPGNPSTDQGGVEQDVLGYWLNQGIPILPTVGSTGTTFDKLTAFYEVDPRHLNDIRWTIHDCGFAYIGIDMPARLMDNVPDVWDVFPGNDDGGSDGGHCVILPASLPTENFKLISWGRVYEMTPAFFSRYCDEAYGLVDNSWVNAKGTTPGGLTLGELEAQMAALKES
jgi:hypothetical protein